MKKHQFKALVREIIRGIVSERSAQAQANRNKQKQMARDAGQNALSKAADVFTRNADDTEQRSKRAYAVGDTKAGDSFRLGAQSDRGHAATLSGHAADPAMATRAGRIASRIAQAGRNFDTSRGGSVQSPTLANKLNARPQTPQGPSGMTPNAQAAQAGAGKAAEKAAEQGLKKIPGTFGLYSKSGAPPAEFRSSKGELVPVKSSSGKLTENKMLLKNLIRENMERRLNLMKISAIMEKVLPEVSKDQANKLSELFTEVSMLATQMNTMPHTKFNMMEWKLSVGMVHSKLYELKEEVMKICEKEDRVDLMPLVRAIEEACQQ